MAVDDHMTAFDLSVRMLKKYCQTDSVRVHPEHFFLHYDAQGSSKRKMLSDNCKLAALLRSKHVEQLYLDSVGERSEGLLSLRIFNADGWILNEEARLGDSGEEAAPSPSSRSFRRYAPVSCSCCAGLCSSKWECN
mgnify:CR=1 FL=1